MPLFITLLVVFIIAIIGAILTYHYLDNSAHDDDKLKYSLMVFCIIIAVSLFILYMNGTSSWVANNIKPSAP